jgi:hypothetical protein
MLVRGALAAKLLKTGSTSGVFNARLVEQVRPDDRVWAQAGRQVTAWMLRTRSDAAATAQRQALAVLDGVIGTDGPPPSVPRAGHTNERFSGR